MKTNVIRKSRLGLAATLLVVISAAAFATTPTAQSTGSLRVFIAPPEAVDAGAMWRIANFAGIDWQRSGATLSNIRPGNYTVEFTEIRGWQAPVSQRVSITRGRIALLDVEYRSFSGSLIVSIEPPEAVGAGAMWRREGTEIWLRSGEQEDNVPEGDWAIEFVSIKDWEQPTGQTVRVPLGRTATVRVVYKPMWGSLTVTIDPGEAGNAGALWRRQGTAQWFYSGTTENEIPSGTYTIEFLDVKYWDKSPVKQVRIDSGQTANMTGTYRRQKGVLTVNIEPKEAVTDGAQWRFKGDDDWHASGRTLQNAPAGENIVKFKSIAGWKEPDDATVIVDPRRPATVTGKYGMEKGALTVNIEPSKAVEAGGKWRIAEEGYDWRVSGSTKTNVPVGTHTVEFSEIEGWDTPEKQKVKIVQDQTATITARYSSDYGGILVDIQPEAAVQAGAEWRIVGTPNWRESGRMRESIKSGEWIIEFKDIPDWKTPDNISVAVKANETTNVTGAYKKQRPATLTIILKPKGAVDNGAMWRIAGTNQWFASGETADGVAPGQVTVEFKSAEGWKKPADLQVRVKSGEDAKADATYEKKR